MIEIVTDRKLITKYQKLFVQKLKTVCSKKISCNLGFQGDSFSSPVFYSSIFDFWFAAYENENRYWNAFGVGEPPEGKNTSISVEINFPYEGINRNIGGLSVIIIKVKFYYYIEAKLVAVELVSVNNFFLTIFVET
jgi:hypothetical protein